MKLVQRLNMLNLMVLFTFSTLGRRYPFWANLVQQIIIFLIGWSFIPGLIKIVEFGDDVYFVCLGPEIPFLGKFGPKIQNYLFKLKFGMKTISNLPDLVVLCHKSEIQFLGLFDLIKVTCLSWSLALRLTWMYWTQWCC